MKMKSLLPRLLFGLMILGLSAGCNKADDDDNSSAVTSTAADVALMTNWTDDVVIPTYKDMQTKVKALQTALETLRDSATQANYDAAKTAWLASRVPWEQSEAFLGGPVADKGLDPAMDSWPTTASKIDALLNDVSANKTVDVATLDEDAKGFHAIEYILWGVAGSKTLGTQTAAERKLAAMYAADIYENISLVVTDWEDSFDGGISYRDRFLNSGIKDPAIHASSAIAIDEIVTLMTDIAEEVGTTKIGGPHGDAGDSELIDAIESAYSDNSIVDFKNNVKSILHAYQGSLTGTASTTSVSARVKAKNAALNTSVETAINDALDGLDGITLPFRTSVHDSSKDAEIETAMAKLKTLRNLLDGDVREAVK